MAQTGPGAQEESLSVSSTQLRAEYLLYQYEIPGNHLREDRRDSEFQSHTQYQSAA